MTIVVLRGYPSAADLSIFFIHLNLEMLTEFTTLNDKKIL